MRQTLTILLLLGCSILAHSQVSSILSKRYDYGKSLYHESNFSAAIEVFESILEKSPNLYQYHSRYFLSLCHFKLKNIELAKQELLPLLNDSSLPLSLKDEVAFLMGVLELESNNYETGFKLFQKIKDSHLSQSTKMASKKYFAGLSPETLLAFYKLAPDKISDDLLFAKILQMPPQKRPQELLPRLRQKFSFHGTEKTLLKKDTLRVAVFLPFNFEKVNPSNPFNPSQRYLDYYQGLRMGVDDLDSLRIPLRLYAYDTEKDSSKLVNFFMMPEIRSMDLIIGPLTPQNFSLAQEFATQYQIPIIYPLWATGNTDFSNPYTFSLSSSEKTQAEVAAGFSVSYLESKVVYVVYDDNKTDSAIAAQHILSFERLGGQVRSMFRISREKGIFPKLLAELKKADQEKINHHIFAAVKDEASAMTLVSALSNLTGKRPLLVPSAWLDLNQIHYEQLERLNTYVMSTDFFPETDSSNQMFVSRFTQKYNIIPFDPSYLAYETIMYFGKKLSKYHKEAIRQIKKSDPEKGVVFQGIDFRRSNDNRFFPILKFNNGELEMANSFEP
jgi:ABC-type branched-subunit amino acid transport system substrate-binding protein